MSEALRGCSAGGRAFSSIPGGDRGRRGRRSSTLRVRGRVPESGGKSPLPTSPARPRKRSRTAGGASGRAPGVRGPSAAWAVSRCTRWSRRRWRGLPSWVRSLRGPALLAGGPVVRARTPVPGARGLLGAAARHSDGGRGTETGSEQSPPSADLTHAASHLRSFCPKYIQTGNRLDGCSHTGVPPPIST